MTLPMMDGHGNLHHASGPGGGQFAAKAPAPPVAPLASASERLRARVRVNWQHLFDPDGANTPVDIPGDSRRKRDGLSWFRRGGGRAPNSRAVATKSFVTSVSIPTYTSEHAPVTITVDGAASGDEVAREYRAVDGQLFRQVWGIEDPGTEGITPTTPEAAAWAPTEPGRTYELRPVPADEEWLRQETERAPAFAATTEEEAAHLVQARMDGYASIDGDVWQATEAPVYRAPIVDDAPFTEPLAVAVTPAPDTAAAAADLGYFHADSYDDAVHQMHVTADELGLPVAPGQDTVDPPIRWMRELGLISDEPEWRAGTPLIIEPSETLTETSFRDRLAAFREQIVTIPGAVTGDVGSFLVVGDWKLDFAALTRQQQDEYRRYIVFGVERGLI